MKKRIDVEALGLGRVVPGAIVRADGGAYRLSDPLRRPGELIEVLRSPVASWRDKLRTARLVFDVTAQPVSRLLHRQDVSTAERLAAAGLSPAFVRAFWRPLFGGIQLDPELEVSHDGSSSSCGCSPPGAPVFHGRASGRCLSRSRRACPEAAFGWCPCRPRPLRRGTDD